MFESNANYFWKYWCEKTWVNHVRNLFLTGIPLSMAMAENKATPGEVHEKFLRADEVKQQLGGEGLAAFSDSKGEFV